MIELADFAMFPPAGLPRSAAVTVGNFDGCHRGHQELVRAAVALAARHGATPVAVTFRPRPEAFFRPDRPDPRLFTDAQKGRALAELGIGCHVARRFDAAFSRTPAADFYCEHLRTALGAVALVVGDDFRFGHERRGSAAELAQWCKQDGLAFQVGVVAEHAGARISSTRVRETLASLGDAAAAAAMLGRPYLLEGVIARGDQLGRQLGVPTANLEGIDQLLPRFGIYAGYVWLGAEHDGAATPPVTTLPASAIPAVFSLGIRPTLANAAPPVRVEAHLLRGTYGPDALYGRRAGFYLANWLRPEATFPDLESLKAQMQRDIADAKRLVGG